MTITRPRLIFAVTGSRGEWGYLRPVLERVRADAGLDYRLLATNMHLLPEFGLSAAEIEADGFEIHERIYMAFSGYTPATMAKSLGALLLELPAALDRWKPDLLLLAGDRGEQLMAAVAAVHLEIPVAHIQCGELSGNVDGVVRHAITKLAHLHLAANEDFADRVRRLGEQEFRIHVTGAPAVDDLLSGPVAEPAELCARYDLEESGRLVLVVQHPVTEEHGHAEQHLEDTLAALADVGWPAILIYPNSDAGSAAVRRRLDAEANPSLRIVPNLPRRDYLGLLRLADVLVGNSSSGLIEAPTFSTPFVNLGTRQNGRTQSSNVLNVGHNGAEIAAAIRKAASPDFRARCCNSPNPYGDGQASERIVAILKQVDLNDRLMRKQLQ